MVCCQLHPVALSADVPSADLAHHAALPVIPFSTLPGRSEVDELHDPLGGEEDIARLDVAVRHAVRVQERQGGEQAARDVHERALGKPGLGAQEVGQRQRQCLEREPVLPIVGVVEQGDNLPSATNRITRCVRWDV